MPALHLAVLLFAAAAWVAQATTLSPGALALGRCLVAAPPLLALALREGRRTPWPGGIHLFGPGVLLAVHWTAFFHAVRLGGVPMALLTYASFPAFSLLQDHAWPDPSRPLPPRSRQWWQLGLLGAGLACLAAAGGAPVRCLALVFGLASGATFAGLARWNSSLRHRHGAAPLLASQVLTAVLWLAPWHLAELARATLRDWGLLVVLGLVCTALGHGLFIHALRRVPPFQAAVAAGLEPVYGVVFCALAGGSVTGREWLALPLVAGAALLGSTRSARSGT